MEIALVGESQPLFSISVDLAKDTTRSLKDRLLSAFWDHEFREYAYMGNRIRLFSQFGVEFFNDDLLSLFEDDKRLYFSCGEPFDFQVCMEYYEIK